MAHCRKSSLLLFFIVLILTLMGCTPIEPEPLAPSPEQETVDQLRILLADDPDNQSLKSSYASALMELDIAESAQANITEGNQPFLLFQPNATSCILLIHGFGASPYEMKPLGAYLFQQKMNVYGILLDGHATSFIDFEKTKKEGWVAGIEKKIESLKPLCSAFFIGGLSFGGDLSIAAGKSQDIAGIISINSPIFFYDERIMDAKKYLPFVTSTSRNLTEHQSNYYYRALPTRAIAEMADFINALKQDLPSIKPPILIIQSWKDERVRPESAELIRNSIGSKKITRKYYPEGTHVLTLGPLNETLGEDIVVFMGKLTNKR
ncbi:alpha/beta hydrolase [Candidatus Woesearchaeota archaeon]|nr:alpha/beta hydrolase [Candidatus Woesearchaeota archaeon]